MEPLFGNARLLGIKALIGPMVDYSQCPAELQAPSLWSHGFILNQVKKMTQ